MVAEKILDAKKIVKKSKKPASAPESSGVAKPATPAVGTPEPKVEATPAVAPAAAAPIEAPKVEEKPAEIAPIEPQKDLPAPAEAKPEEKPAA